MAAGDSPEAHLEAGLASRARGDWLGALNAFRDAFKLDPDNRDIALALGSVLANVRTKDYDSRIDNLLVGVLRASGPDYQAMAPAVAHQLLLKYGIAEDGTLRQPLDPADPLLRHYLKQCLNVVPALEFALTRQRREILLASAGVMTESALDMATLIAQQCFLNEYVFLAEDVEEKIVTDLQARLEEGLRAGKFSDGFGAEMIVFAMYRPLSALYGAADQVARLEASPPVDFSDVVRLTLRDYLEEEALRGSISSFSDIRDPTSRAVRSQYEANPYPRWMNLPHIAPVDLAAAFARRFPHFVSRGWVSDPQTILVAGCGTGRHAANVARQWPEARILAIDLSTASIAYAMRQLKALGVRNVEFRHGDILEAGRIEGPFDMVQSVGVLHHMERPVEGWRVLAGLLRPGGLFHGGLYAERARHGVVAARRAIARDGIADDYISIVQFRRTILTGQVEGDFSALIRLADFFSTSNCRDLMFHVHEDTYTPLRLKDEIAAVGLEFIGFNHYAELGLDAAYTGRFPDEPTRTDLDNWEALERSLGTLETGYDFWCWKPLS